MCGEKFSVSGCLDFERLRGLFKANGWRLEASSQGCGVIVEEWLSPEGCEGEARIVIDFVSEDEFSFSITGEPRYFHGGGDVMKMLEGQIEVILA